MRWQPDPRCAAAALDTSTTTRSGPASAPSPLPAAAGRFVIRALAHFSSLASRGDMAALGGDALLGDRDAAAVARSVTSPAPPPTVGRPGAFGWPWKKRGVWGQFPWGRTGSAANPWIWALCGAKSLILEAMPSTCRLKFSTGCSGFSTGCVVSVRRRPSFSSLSKSLKEKRKEQGGKQAEGAQGHPRVAVVSPRVVAPAYFFIHGFHRSGKTNPWKSVEAIPFIINELCQHVGLSTDPQVALPVLPLHEVLG